ncbi:UNVERIFIED_CONTAM: hypothetical protein Slati_0370300 [Sesamum latifolium]|uniref:Uncharacterized protein n=1 Tax=Sesamum latifolium TaxID=2727402 RepID=A0AAW2YIG9_9LAMI
MAYGWPQVIPLEAPNCVSTQQIVYLKVVNRLLLVVSPTHIELWSSSQHRVRLGKYKRDVDSIRKEGENLRAVWSPDTKLIAVLFSGAFFLDVWPNDKVGANKLSPHLGNGLTFSGTQGVDRTNHVNHVASRSSGVVHLEFSIMLRLLFVLFSDGNSFNVLSARKQILAVGTRKGTVELYDLADSASLIRSVALHDWGYSVEDTGPVNCIAWTPDDSALQLDGSQEGLQFGLSLAVA